MNKQRNHSARGNSRNYRPFNEERNRSSEDPCPYCGRSDYEPEEERYRRDSYEHNRYGGGRYEREGYRGRERGNAQDRFDRYEGRRYNSRQDADRRYYYEPEDSYDPETFQQAGSESSVDDRVRDVHKKYSWEKSLEEEQEPESGKKSKKPFL